jgi:anti-sigma-K factor RskA
MRIRRRPEPHTLSGAYALDALTGADRARFERHLARCEHCALEIRELSEATARLATAAACEPPAGLTERVLAVAARTRQLPPVVLGSRTERRAWMPRIAVATAAAAAAVAGLFGVAARTAEHRLDAQQQIAIVLTAQDATMLSGRVATGGTATIVMSHQYGELVFAAAGLRSLPSSEGYELWLMGPDGDRSAGMLPGPRSGMTGPVVASGLAAGDRLGLTIEPAGGAPRPASTTILLIAL